MRGFSREKGNCEIKYCLYTSFRNGEISLEDSLKFYNSDLHAFLSSQIKVKPKSKPNTKKN